MGAALGREDVVGEGEHVFGEAVVPLERDLHRRAVLHAIDGDGRLEQRLLVLVQIFHEGDDAALVVIGALDVRFHALVDHGDADALVQERHLAEAGLERVEAEIAGFEDARLGRFAGLDIGPEGDGGARAVGGAHDLQVVENLAALVFLLVDLAVLIDIDLQVLGQGVDY